MWWWILILGTLRFTRFWPVHVRVTCRWSRECYNQLATRWFYPLRTCRPHSTGKLFPCGFCSSRIHQMHVCYRWVCSLMLALHAWLVKTLIRAVLHSYEASEHSLPRGCCSVKLLLEPLVVYKQRPATAVVCSVVNPKFIVSLHSYVVAQVASPCRAPLASRQTRHRLQVN